MIVSRTRRPPAAQMLARELGAEYIEMGSAGAKAMAVVRGLVLKLCGKCTSTPGFCVWNILSLVGR